MARFMSFVGCILMADVNDDGSLTTGEWTDVGEAYPLSMKMSEEIIKKISRKCDTAGSVVGTKQKPAEAAGSLTLHEYRVANVARALRGMVSVRDVSSSTLTAEPVTLKSFDKYVDIGTEDLSSVVVQDATDTTTYVLGTDYRLNAVLGLIAPISGGSNAENEVVHISAAGAANTDNRITIGAGSTQKVAIKGNLKDEYSGEIMKVYLRKVTLAAGNEINFVSDESTEHEQIDFEMVPEIPTGQTDIGTIDGLPL